MTVIPTAQELGFGELAYTKTDDTPRGREDHDDGHDDNAVAAPGHHVPPGWPEPISPRAFHGLAGEYVNAVASETESDPVALLIQILAAFGSAVGHGPHFYVEATPHHTNLFAVLVGNTAKARKGTSWNHAKRLIATADPTWELRRSSGLSSGEGLIEAVRDGQPAGDDGDSEHEDRDPGVEDKRLIVHQGEFASVLAVMARPGNTLSAVIRDAWDGETLSTMCRKHNSLRATGAHISILAHVTKDEVRRTLAETEAANGFANRFLWLCVRRSKLLPEGGNVQLDPALISKMGAAIQFASKIGEMRRDDAARKIWWAVYPDLSRDVPGMVGSITARAEAQVLRLSCIYALLDGSSLIRQEHLNAALAVWDYAERSVRYIFGDNIGDAVADSILSVLRDRKEGMSRTEISNLFARNKSAERIQIALDLLLSLGKVRKATEQTGGRPLEVWFANTKETN